MVVVFWFAASNLFLGLLICLFGWSQTASAAARALRSHLQILAGRSWGTYHRFLQGAYWENDEHELFRTDVRSVSVFAVDGYTDIEQNAACVLTDRRLVICDPKGTMLQIPLAAIRATRAQRAYDHDAGYTYAVAIDRGAKIDHDPRGDVRVDCTTDRQSHDLASSIQDAIDDLVRSDAAEAASHP